MYGDDLDAATETRSRNLRWVCDAMHHTSGEQRAHGLETTGATSRRRETITTPDHRGREALTFRAVESHTETMQRVPSPVQRRVQERDGVCTCAAKPRTSMQTPLPSAATRR